MKITCHHAGADTKTAEKAIEILLSNIKGGVNPKQVLISGTILYKKSIK